jgi:hypothetical protein
VVDIDLRRCPNCGAGELRIIAAILQRAAIGKSLTHLVWFPGRRPGDGRVRRGTRATRSPPAEKRVPSNGSGSAFDRDVYGAQQHGPLGDALVADAE